MKKSPALLAGACAVLLLAGCAQMKEMMPGSGPAATATLAPTRGSSTSGTVRFVQTGNTVQVSGEIRGLKPNSEHGFHVHEKGDCSSGDGMSTGAHWNPDNQPHGRYDAPRHHSGDLPSLRADGAGNAKFQFESSAFRVGSGSNDVIGKGLIVHRDPDDYTQPAGNSGPRLACAVIVRS
jgi:Cu-Zn family superoxide dismutase